MNTNMIEHTIHVFDSLMMDELFKDWMTAIKLWMLFNS